MKLSTIESASDVFNCSKNASIYWQSIQFQEFQVFTLAVQRLIKAVGQLDEDDYWFRFVNQVRRFRFDAIAAPLSEEALQSQLSLLISRFHKDYENFKNAHPGAIEHYLKLINTSESLQSIKVNRLLTSLIPEISQQKHQGLTAVLVCTTRLISETEQGLASINIQNVEVTSPSFLREDICFEKMIVIGPTRWFPEYVFAAPRANKLLVQKYSWLRDSWKHKAVFVMPLKQRISKLMQAVVDDPYDDASYSADELLPPAFDFSQIKKRIAEDNVGHHELDYVNAKLFLLEEGWTVFLEDEETSTAHVIDLGDLNSPVKKIKIDDIEPGMYVLLRTGGGGDFIVPAADQIMGKEGIKARQYQKNWKRLLRSQVVATGTSHVINLLRKYGSNRANPSNLRNWIWERSIRTEAREDFDAILKLVGLERESDEYWKNMEMIDSAHRKAGFQIKQMLLEKVETSDLKTLKRTGKMVFELAGKSSISITAFQVMEIAPEKMQILPWKIGDLIKQEG